jgi:hypothetical protein
MLKIYSLGPLFFDQVNKIACQCNAFVDDASLQSGLCTTAEEPPMTRSELWITWIVSAFPLIFVVLLVMTSFKEFMGPFAPLGFLAVYYFKVWVLTDNAALKKRVENWGRPITKRHGIFMVLAIPGLIALLVLLSWMEKLIGRESIIAALVAAFAIIWLKECRDAWKKSRK